MSVTIYPWSKPGKQSPADPEYGDCCGLRPVLLRWPRQIYIGVICQNPGCINSHNGVLACDADIAEKWGHYRNKGGSDGRVELVSKKLIRLDTDFIVEVIYGPENLNIPMIALETMAGGRIVLGPEELDKLEAALPKIKATLAEMMGNNKNPLTGLR